MKYFTQLFTELDQTPKTLGKIKPLVEYFEKAADQDKLWAVALLSHRRPKRTVNTSYLAEWANDVSRLPAWLCEESYRVVGDLSEAMTLVLPSEVEPSDFSLTYWMDFVKDLESRGVQEKKQQILWAWQRLSESE